MAIRLKSRRAGVALAMLWLAGLAIGFAALEQYEARPGSVASAALGSAPVQAAPCPADRPRLVMFLHPRCPCSQASLTELARVLEQAPRQVQVEVAMVRPPGVADEWEQSPLVAAAKAIPSAVLTWDAGGERARRHGATTSGHIVFFDADGRWQYSGGITRSRGHAGESTGSRALAALLRGETQGARSAAVFGCPLAADDGFGKEKARSR